MAAASRPATSVPAGTPSERARVRCGAERAVVGCPARRDQRRIESSASASSASAPVDDPDPQRPRPAVRRERPRAAELDLDRCRPRRPRLVGPRPPSARSAPRAWAEEAQRQVQAVETDPAHVARAVGQRLGANLVHDRADGLGGVIGEWRGDEEPSPGHAGVRVGPRSRTRLKAAPTAPSRTAPPRPIRRAPRPPGSRSRGRRAGPAARPRGRASRRRRPPCPRAPCRS